MTHTRLHFGLATVVAALALLPGPGRAQNQYITGRVLDDESEQPLEGVHLALLDSAGVQRADALSDSVGTFALTVPRPGKWWVSAGIIGHSAVRSEPLDLELGERVTLEVRMAVAAVPLDPIVVTGRAHLSPDIRQFYERRNRGERSGFGQYITAAEIDDRGPIEATDLFYGVAGVRVVPGATGSGRSLRMTAGCVPAVFIDGMQINRFRASESIDDYLPVFSIEGIEIYRGAGYQVGRFNDPGGCGLVLIWTRRGEMEPGSHFSWKKLALGLGLVAAIFLIL